MQVFTLVFFTVVFANTVNISAIPPLEIHIFPPLSRKVLPSSDNVARVWIEAASLPLWAKTMICHSLNDCIYSCYYKQMWWYNISMTAATMYFFQVTIYMLQCKASVQWIYMQERSTLRVLWDKMLPHAPLWPVWADTWPSVPRCPQLGYPGQITMH